MFRQRTELVFWLGSSAWSIVTGELAASQCLGKRCISYRGRRSSSVTTSPCSAKKKNRETLSVLVATPKHETNTPPKEVTPCRLPPVRVPMRDSTASSLGRPARPSNLHCAMLRFRAYATLALVSLCAVFAPKRSGFSPVLSCCLSPGTRSVTGDADTARRRERATSAMGGIGRGRSVRGVILVVLLERPLSLSLFLFLFSSLLTISRQRNGVVHTERRRTNKHTQHHTP